MTSHPKIPTSKLAIDNRLLLDNAHQITNKIHKQQANRQIARLTKKAQVKFASELRQIIN